MPASNHYEGSKLKRPLTIWIVQITLLFYGALNCLALLGKAALAVKSLSATGINLASILWLVLAVSAIVILFAASWGLAKRKIYGRWLGLMVALFLWLGLLYAQLWLSNGQWKSSENLPIEVLVMDFITQAFIHLFFLILIFRLLFAASVKKFFREATLQPI